MTEEYDLDDLNSLPAETEEINSAAELQSENRNQYTHEFQHVDGFCTCGL